VGFAVRLLEGVIKRRRGGEYVHRENTLSGGLNPQNLCLVLQVCLLWEGEERLKIKRREGKIQFLSRGVALTHV
jgi:hypothetical protein